MIMQLSLATEHALLSKNRILENMLDELAEREQDRLAAQRIDEVMARVRSGKEKTYTAEEFAELMRAEGYDI
ncbi:hypothetical protein FHQ26_12510 [Testudinibacter sp. TR-2022]|nr:hypothetical protein [Testudinibacter sp. TR-2022]TNH05623.1 hypothetical protein FHQ22_00495 [Pasteurellaceae bacterium Phil31]TNH04111.1 hypothetical protein FHQ26_12510 [Testudinibacter sp. TR-2022]TNH10587.1 hypothetical protein FHQ25_04955 [Testudinibacter sp. TR-2022]TNH14058.1 hypothetical protein FIA56_05735 [Testudinibacter sp. TR-2022]TNH19290.1 hypothetical protein FHQ23_03460 [Testudinibacter sp. TR-2022]